MQRASLLLAFLGLVTACTKATVDAPSAPPTGETSPAVTASPGPSFPGTERPTNVVAGDAACAIDADCVPSACCHARSCVAKAEAPACGDAMCTQECKGGTIDCGGGCLCQEGRCAAKIVEARLRE